MPVKEYCITMFMPKDCNGDIDCTVYYGTCCIEKEIKRKKQIKFTLDNNEKDNKRKMEMIRYESLKLKYTEDTSTVVLLTLSDSISYGEYVSILDMCDYDGHKRFASWDNKFVIFGEYPKVEKPATDTLQLFSCGYVYFKKPVIKPGFFELLNRKINNLYTPQGLYLLLGWAVLLISFLAFKRRNSVLQEY